MEGKINTDNYSRTESSDSRREREEREFRRKKRIRTAKIGGDMMMYVGSAALMRPFIAKAQETNNGIMSACATAAGTVLTLGIGNMASKVLERTIDKVVAFWDDVKPNGPASKNPGTGKQPETEKQEEKADG